MLLLGKLGVLTEMNTTLVSFVTRIVVYVVMAGLMLFVTHRWLDKGSIGWSNFGVGRLMTYKDMLLALAGFFIYAVLTIASQFVLMKVPGYDASQAQDLGVSTNLYGRDLASAFLVFVALTPIAEEFLFRGVFYGWLKSRKMPKWGIYVVVSLMFGLAHGQWNVAIDVFWLSMVACYMRDMTSSIWPGVVMHMLKNGLAFWFVFVASRGLGG